MTHGSDSLYLGRNDGVGTYFDGIIDDASIYSEALSATRILETFEAGETRNETVTQLPNPSATENLSGWSEPEYGVFERSTSTPYSSPASFLLSYKGGWIPPHNYPTVTTSSGKIETTLLKGKSYTLRYRARWGGGSGLLKTSGPCVYLYFKGGGEEKVCQEWRPIEKTWKFLGFSFFPSGEVSSYRVDFTLGVEGFLEFFTGTAYFDDFELVPAG